MNRDDEPSVPAGVTRAHADDELIRALYEQHGRVLFGYVLRLVDGDRGRAEDIVQETIIRAWRHPEAVGRDPQAIRPWLFTVARNLVVDAYRAARVRPQEAGADGLALVAAGDDVPTEVDRALEAWEVADALNSLSPDHRRVLVETYYRGRSVAEAAAVLGIPQGTVKSRTYYALRALRLILEERGVTLA
ncbi:MAG: sigma-70 family RNA polymerase sigma factor [Acidothermus sp.]|nr:sigma-70 family RNA polymerase sigma factor [Acidothermus sp.]MCL6537288.1 sigma-70 family RNA polymerase sigma factor [Acidothermus sp.]